ncbi:hypothetical protein NE237_012784 [Protea cynaroides]|uniref:Uncharacterized protein n=1 Tax=Protea cynaroides TaxID=273540 RepID=A0A9Q0GXF3_9MAGN|nr:hypothetical protein NE237_012784 [Protea cynaroides]
MCKALGRPVGIDRNTTNKIVGRFARLQVEVVIGGQRPEEIMVNVSMVNSVERWADVENDGDSDNEQDPMLEEGELVQSPVRDAGDLRCDEVLGDMGDVVDVPNVISCVGQGTEKESTAQGVLVPSISVGDFEDNHLRTLTSTPRGSTSIGPQGFLRVVLEEKFLCSLSYVSTVVARDRCIFPIVVFAWRKGENRWTMLAVGSTRGRRGSLITNNLGFSHQRKPKHWSEYIS